MIYEFLIAFAAGLPFVEMAETDSPIKWVYFLVLVAAIIASIWRI